ncbi:hypothetical protein MMRN_27200 [Mycobacterium marinum]|nr:hypothetical protein MMRN_27200 [Mycobacterium marinum]
MVSAEAVQLSVPVATAVWGDPDFGVTAGAVVRAGMAAPDWRSAPVSPVESAVTQVAAAPVVAVAG